MLIPLVCTHCGTSLADKYEAWKDERPPEGEKYNTEGHSAQEVLEANGVRRRCCKKIMLCANTELLHILNQYRRPPIHTQQK